MGQRGVNIGIRHRFYWVGLPYLAAAIICLCSSWVLGRK